MTQAEPAVLATVGTVMVLYLCVLLFIGWRAARRTHGGDDFHLAGRSLGAWAAGISSTASSESGWVTLGAVGMTYVHGVSGLWFAPGCLLGYLVNLYLVAPRLKDLADANGSVTLTDVLTRRWGDPGNVLRLVATVITLLCMMGYVAAQMTAAGKAFSSTFALGGSEQGTLAALTSGIGRLARSIGSDADPSYLLGVLVGAVVITVVTSLGGFRAVAWTDLFQGLLMAFALIAMPLYAVHRFGGFAALFSALGATDPDLLTATGGRLGPALWGFVVGELGIGLGYPGMPHVLTRYMAARNQREIHRLRIIALLWGVAVFYGAGMLGMIGRVSLPSLADGEEALIALALQLLHPVLAGLILAAVFSAILSTVSSQLLVVASAVSYDIVECLLERSADDRRSLRLGRITVVLVGIVGIAFALSKVRLVFWFVLFAWSGLGASFGPLVLLSLGGTKVNRHGALAAMLTGFGVTVVWKLGRGAQDSPDVFAHAPFAVAVVTAVLLVILALAARHVEKASFVAVLIAAAATFGAWFLVQAGGLNHLYELVPAFFAAGAVALLTSRVCPASQLKA